LSIRSVSFIKQNNITGNVLLPFKWGGYVTWKLYPDVKVSVDGRYIEIYSEKVFKENNDFYYKRGDWKKILRENKVDVLLVDKLYSPVYPAIMSDDSWKLVYEDNLSAVFLPSDSILISKLKRDLMLLVVDKSLFKSYFMDMKD
jgi:hypothetical protein